MIYPDKLLLLAPFVIIEVITTRVCVRDACQAVRDSLSTSGLLNNGDIFVNIVADQT